MDSVSSHRHCSVVMDKLQLSMLITELNVLIVIMFDEKKRDG